MVESQKSRILSFLFSTTTTTIKQISESLKIPQPSVRRALHDLRTEKAINVKNPRTRKVVYTPIKITAEKLKFTKYTLNHVLYCSSKLSTYKAVTYSKKKLNIKDLMLEMIFEVENITSDICSPVRDSFGMELKEVTKAPFTYPEIQVSKYWRAFRE